MPVVVLVVIQWDKACLVFSYTENEVDFRQTRNIFLALPFSFLQTHGKLVIFKQSGTVISTNVTRALVNVDDESFATATKLSSPFYLRPKLSSITNYILIDIYPLTRFHFLLCSIVFTNRRNIFTFVLLFFSFRFYRNENINSTVYCIILPCLRFIYLKKQGIGTIIFYENYR